MMSVIFHLYAQNHRHEWDVTHPDEEAEAADENEGCSCPYEE